MNGGVGGLNTYNGGFGGGGAGASVATGGGGGYSGGASGATIPELEVVAVDPTILALTS